MVLRSTRFASYQRMVSVGAHFPATEPFATFLSTFQFPTIPSRFLHSTFRKEPFQNPKIMLKWSSSPVRCRLRFFSTVRFPPGGGIDDVDIIRPQIPTIRPPTKVKRRSVPENWCSFIGQITAPVMMYRLTNGVFTFLEVKGPLAKQTTSPCQICISMNGELAQVALRYLQKKQYVFVSGFLRSYNKINHVHYKVAVRELNFVRTHSQNEVPCTTREELKNEEMALASSTMKDSGSCDVSNEERTRERQILWQIFFANPFEWWDQRTTKRTSKHPDFKHKSTGEALWIRSDDPPWVNKQLNLYDAKISESNLFRKQDDLGLQGWKIQDFVNL